MALHYNAVKDFIMRKDDTIQDSLYANIIQLDGLTGFPRVRKKNSYDWLEQFILADINTLRRWVNYQPEKLLFTDFYKLYISYFSNGADKYVDSAKTYNSYTLIEAIGINVCPYCDDEYIDVVDEEGNRKRTGEIDHFFPKAVNNYPALSMCFYNLVLSGQNCNGLKKRKILGSSPYDYDIEELTFISPNIDLGSNYESLDPQDCKLSLNANMGMIQNDRILSLSIRYNNRRNEAYSLLKRRQQFPDEKIEELVRMGLYESVNILKESLFGPIYEVGKFKVIHQKMKKDLIGY